MADNMCGPSNGAKNLVSHFDRDRSVHQDRIAGVRQTNGGATFRSHTGLAPGADGAFHAFQHAGSTAAAGAAADGYMPMPEFAAYAGPNGHIAFAGPPAAEMARYPPPAAAAGAEGVHGMVSVPTAANNVRPAHGFTDGASEVWVNEFANMRLGPAAVAYPSMNLANDSFGPNFMGQRAQDVAGAHAQFQAGYYAYQAQPPHGAVQFVNPYQYPAMSSAATTVPQAAFSGVLHAPAAESVHEEQAFNLAFGDYDEDEFQRELDAWTRAHGDPEPPKTVGPPTAAEMAQIDADLEVLAQELEARRAAGDPAVLPTKGPEAEARQARQQQDELAKAAMDILTSVSENRSDKFRNSSFFELMRRISVREIAVEGNELVELATGEVVASKEAKAAADGHAEETQAAPVGPGEGNTVENAMPKGLYAAPVGIRAQSDDEN